MCIRDSNSDAQRRLESATQSIETDPFVRELVDGMGAQVVSCLLYTSDAADERSSVDLGGRRIIKKKTPCTHNSLRKLDDRQSHLNIAD